MIESNSNKQVERLIESMTEHLPETCESRLEKVTVDCSQLSQSGRHRVVVHLEYILEEMPDGKQ